MDDLDHAEAPMAALRRLAHYGLIGPARRDMAAMPPADLDTLDKAGWIYDGIETLVKKGWTAVKPEFIRYFIAQGAGGGYIVCSNAGDWKSFQTRDVAIASLNGAPWQSTDGLVDRTGQWDPQDEPTPEEIVRAQGITGTEEARRALIDAKRARRTAMAKELEEAHRALLQCLVMPMREALFGERLEKEPLSVELLSDLPAGTTIPWKKILKPLPEHGETFFGALKADRSIKKSLKKLLPAEAECITDGFDRESETVGMTADQLLRFAKARKLSFKRRGEKAGKARQARKRARKARERR